MPRTLVIQLGRLGDVIQTTPLLGELTAVGDTVDVLVLRSAHAALLRFAAVANIEKQRGLSYFNESNSPACG